MKKLLFVILILINATSCSKEKASEELSNEENNIYTFYNTSDLVIELTVSENSGKTLVVELKSKEKKSLKIKDFKGISKITPLGTTDRNYIYEWDSDTNTFSIVKKPLKQWKCGFHNGNQLWTGPKGGCYYFNSNNNKTYVGRGECNCSNPNN